MGILYSKISRLQLNDNNERKSVASHEIQPQIETAEPKTPCTLKPEYLLDPRSATAGIKRTPLVVLHKVTSSEKEADSTPLSGLPYLETDLDSSIFSIRTSTPVLSASPMKDVPQSSPVFPRCESEVPYDELSLSQQDEMLNMDSDEENNTEELFNNERMLFDSEEQGSFDEMVENKVEHFMKDHMDSLNKSEMLNLSDNTNDDNEVQEIFTKDLTKTTAESNLELEFSEIEECVFSPINPTENSKLIKSVPDLKKDNLQLAKTKSGRTPLGTVSSNPCQPLPTVHNNLIMANKDVDVTKPWRDITEERVNRGILGVENTPPATNLPPPDVIQSAPGKLLLNNRARTGKAAWGRDTSLII